MANYILGVLGISVSVLLFLLGYKQTVGAKRERIAAANSQLEGIFIRRIVLERHSPDRTEVTRLIEGKARDQRVGTEDLLSERQLLNTIYTRITESDLIPAEQRDEILQRINPTISHYEAQPTESPLGDGSAWFSLGNKYSYITVVLFALAVSSIGGVISILPQVKTFHLANIMHGATDALPKLLLTISLSLLAILAASTFVRLRASQEELTSKRSEISDFARFESEVLGRLRAMGVKMQIGRPSSGFDLLIEKNGRKIALEIKNWSGPRPKFLIESAIRRLREATNSFGITEGIIVTRGPVPLAKSEEAKNVKIVTFSGLIQYLKEI